MAEHKLLHKYLVLPENVLSTFAKMSLMCFYSALVPGPSMENKVKLQYCVSKSSFSLWLGAYYQADLVCHCCRPPNAQSLNIHINLQSHLMTHPHVSNRLMGWWRRRCCSRGLWIWVVREERPMPRPVLQFLNTQWRGCPLKRDLNYNIRILSFLGKRFHDNF